MQNQIEIRKARERQTAIVEKRPSAAISTSVTTVRTDRGMTCEIEQGGWKFTGDQPKSKAGGNEGPGPGFFGRAALGLCLTQGYVLWFAKMAVPLEAIEVRVESTIDARGALGISDEVPPGYSGLCCSVEVDSDASEAEILRVLDTADRHSPWLNNFTRPLDASRRVTIRNSRPSTTTAR